MLIQIGAVALLVFVAGFFLWFIVKGMRRQNQLGRWHAVTGTVLDHRTRAVPGGTIAEFLVRYEAGGVAREELCGSEDRLPYPLGTNLQSVDLQAVLKRYFGRYPVGSAIPLRVNPARPTTAYVRERGLPLIAVGIVVAVAFAALLYMTVTVMFQPGMFRQ